jgi:hypothetical protein
MTIVKDVTRDVQGRITRLTERTLDPLEELVSKLYEQARAGLLSPSVRLAADRPRVTISAAKIPAWARSHADEIVTLLAATADSDAEIWSGSAWQTIEFVVAGK